MNAATARFSVSNIQLTPGSGYGFSGPMHAAAAVCKRRRSGTAPSAGAAAWLLDLDVTVEGDTPDTFVCGLLVEHACFIIASCPYSGVDSELSSAAGMLCSYFLSLSRAAAAQGLPYPGFTIHTCEVRLCNPVTTFQTFLRRHASSQPSLIEAKPWGSVDVLFEQRAPADEDGVAAAATNRHEGFGIYLLNVKPHEAIPMHYHCRMKESELVLNQPLTCGSDVLPVGSTHRWGKRKHEYRNESDQVGSIVCVDTPAFVESDEIVCGGAAAGAGHAGVDDAARYWTACMRAAQGAQRSSMPPSKRPRLQSGNHDTDHPSSLPHGDITSMQFPGSFTRAHQGLADRQLVRVVVDPSLWQRPDAVLVVLLSPAGQLLLVRHKVRGWEIPGGKVEQGELPDQAAVRELAEESAVQLDTAALRPIMQYVITESDGSSGGSGQSAAVKPPASHIKTVFTGVLPVTNDHPTLHHETSGVKLVDVWPRHQHQFEAPSAFQSFRSAVSAFSSVARSSASFSPLMKDEVLPLALTLAWPMLGL